MEAKIYISPFEERDHYTGEVIEALSEFYKTVEDEFVSKSTYESGEHNFAICGDCGRLIDLDNDEHEYREATNGDLVCLDCADSPTNYFWCYECEELHSNDDMVVIEPYNSRWGEEHWVCRDCAEYGSYFYCEDCGAWREGTPHTTHDGRDICDRCADNYGYCEDCGELYPSDSLEEVSWNVYYCPVCSQRHIITSYHNHDRSSLDRFNLMGKILGADLLRPENKKLVGTETEVENSDRYNNTCDKTACEVRDIMGDHVHFEYDGSLDNGFEIISEPHTFEALKAAGFDKAFARLKELGYVSHDNENCGLHVHVSNEWFGETLDEQRRNVAKVLNLYSKEFDFFKKLSRREATEYCELTYFTSTADAYENMWRARGHYCAINTQNMTDFGTVEFRLGRGTLNFDTYISWVDICVALARNSQDVPDDCTDLNKWLKGISLKTRGYILSMTDTVIEINNSRRRVVA